MNRRPWLPTLLLWLTSLPSLSAASFRFPPPDFESGHTFPDASGQFPVPREIWLQYLDVAVLAVALVLAARFALWQRSRKSLLWLSVFSLGYFGFYREGCVCAIGSIQNVTLALFQPGYALPLTVTAFFVLPIAVALFFGRSFCAGVCPHGAIQDLVLIRPVKLPIWLEKGLGVLPYVYLGLGVLFAATGSAFVICRFDPFVPIFRVSGGFPMVMTGVVFLLVGMFVGRPYCRFLCPYGALLRLASTVARRKVSVTPDECKLCRICPEACPYGAIIPPTPSPAPETAAASGRQLVLVAVLVPLLMAGAGWAGSRFAVTAAAHLDPNMSLAEDLVARKTGAVTTEPTTVEQLALQRGQRSGPELLTAAVTAQNRFRFGGWMFGAFVGLVIGVRLAAATIWRRHQGYDPDPSSCYECGRCFEFCPQEKRRLRSLASACEVCDAAAANLNPAKPAASGG